ncbi:hypothetical protein GCM10009554_79580 [Kribbella koreensis]|uniref:SH3 domain-containing protein n=1 Tax=Kribbella koreensis TaxID=57909 RepID=A0ABP4C824_9ACTN
MFTKKLVSAVLLTSAVGFALAVPTSASAAPLEDCTGSVNHQDLSAGNNYLPTGTPIRSGPYASCTVRGEGPTTVQLHCWAKNEANHIWWFVNLTGQTTKGWAYEPNLYYTVVRHESNRCRV